MNLAVNESKQPANWKWKTRNNSRTIRTQCCCQCPIFYVTHAFSLMICFVSSCFVKLLPNFCFAFLHLLIKAIAFPNHCPKIYALYRNHDLWSHRVVALCYIIKRNFTLSICDFRKSIPSFAKLLS